MQHAFTLTFGVIPKEHNMSTKHSIAVSVNYTTVKIRPSLSRLLKHAKCKDKTIILGDFAESSETKYSYFLSQPNEVFSITEIDHDILERFNHTVTKYSLNCNDTLPVPFIGGWAGYISYDIAGGIERLPNTVTNDLHVPLIHFAFYDAIIAWDHQQQIGYLITLTYDGQLCKTKERLDTLKHIYDDTINAPAPIPASKQNIDSNWQTLITSETTHTDYIKQINQAKAFIASGDIYEVNLSHRFQTTFALPANTLFESLVERNPAAYSALLLNENISIVSASPELFLKKRGAHIESKPIKGTMPRGKTIPEDQAQSEKLYHSTKDQAELNMIIDLLRNDLGRICQLGSISVPNKREIETHPTLFHAVATIQGILKNDITFADILAATFPGGSITGAPKIRAMEIIDSLETTARNIYTGAIGWIGVNGDMDLNIAIRTILLANNKAYFQSGGAIVDDSRAESEYNETIIKADALASTIINLKQM